MSPLDASPALRTSVSLLTQRRLWMGKSWCRFLELFAAFCQGKAKNGNRDLADLEHHVATDPFVLWAWSPGSRPNGNGRLTPPITHEELVQTMKEWDADGASCPTQQ